jgi:hypothetical protein
LPDSHQSYATNHRNCTNASISLIGSIWLTLWPRNLEGGLLLELGAMVQETIRAKDLLTLHEEMTESAITFLTTCELDVVDIRKRVGDAPQIVSVSVRMNPKHFCGSCHLSVGRIEERCKCEGRIRQRRFMPAACADMVNETIGAESLVATPKRTSEIALALVASVRR